jgi:hypothetical protein
MRKELVLRQDQEHWELQIALQEQQRQERTQSKLL